MDNLNMGNVKEKEKTITPTHVNRAIYDLVSDEPLNSVLTKGVFDKNKMINLIKEKINNEYK